MKKRLFGVVLAAVLAAAQVVTAFAADSKTADVIVAGGSAGHYTVADASAASFVGVSDAVRSAILAVNNGTQKLQSIAEEGSDLANSLAGKSMVTEFFELNAVDDGVKAEDGSYLVTLQIPALTSGTTNVQILYYNTATSAWELITPSEVDTANKTVTFTVSQLPGVMSIIANVAAGADNTVGTSPKTGVSSVWAVWMGAAFVLVLTGATVYRKSRTK